jgi:hypothetical protein
MQKKYISEHYLSNLPLDDGDGVLDLPLPFTIVSDGDDDGRDGEVIVLTPLFSSLHFPLSEFLSLTS